MHLYMSATEVELTLLNSIQLLSSIFLLIKLLVRGMARRPYLDSSSLEI